MNWASIFGHFKALYPELVFFPPVLFAKWEGPLAQ